MGMCKGCKEVYNTIYMIDSWCIDCNPKLFEEKKQEEERIKKEEELKSIQDEEYQKKLNKILILSGTINKEHIIHGMVSVVAESDMVGLHSLTVIEAEMLMKAELLKLGYDGVLNVKMDSTVTLGKRKRNDGIPSYTVALYGDAFSYI